MEPTIADKPAIKAVGLAGEFSLETQPQIPALWRRFSARHGEIAAVVKGHSYGLCIGVDNGEDTFTYAAAVEVENLDRVPDGMQAFELAARTYAIFTVPLAGKEPIGKEIGRAFRFVWNTWLPKSGYDFARAGDRILRPALQPGHPVRRDRPLHSGHQGSLSVDGEHRFNLHRGTQG